MVVLEIITCGNAGYYFIYATLILPGQLFFDTTCKDSAEQRSEGDHST